MTSRIPKSHTFSSSSQSFLDPLFSWDNFPLPGFSRLFKICIFLNCKTRNYFFQLDIHLYSFPLRITIFPYYLTFLIILQAYLPLVSNTPPFQSLLLSCNTAPKIFVWPSILFYTPTWKNKVMCLPDLFGLQVYSTYIYHETSPITPQLAHISCIRNLPPLFMSTLRIKT